jgi:hypothetical protein
MDSHRSSLLVPRSTSPSLRPGSAPRGYEPFGGQDQGQGICSPLLLFFSDIPRALCIISSLVALIVIIVIVTLAEAVHTHGACDIPPSSEQSSGQVQTTCGVSGLDFSSLSSYDLQRADSDGQWTLWLRPCGSVVGSPCPAGSQGCLISTQSQIIDFGPYSTTSGAWSLPRSEQAQYLVSSSTSLCNSSPYQLFVSFQCRQSATSPQVYSLMHSGCQFAASIYTNKACTSGQQPADGGAGGGRQQQSAL